MLPKHGMITADQLSFDPNNPRFWFTEPKPQTQEGIAAAFRQQNTETLMNDIAYGLHNAPTSMLVYRKEEKVVVVDGNKRLLAIRLMTEPEFARRMSDHYPTKDIPKVSQDLALHIRNVPVDEFDTWEQAHLFSAYRQSNDRHSWDRITKANDYRRLAELGNSHESIAKWYWLRPEVIARQINSLNIYEQLQEAHPSHIKTKHQFSVVSEAMTMPNIRTHLELGEPEDYSSRERPLNQGALERSAQLLDFILGHQPDTHTSYRQPAIQMTDRESMKNLDRIYENPKALERLAKWPNSTVKDIIAWMDDRPDPYQAVQMVEFIHSEAIKELKNLKDERDDLIPHPGLIHVAQTSHQIFNDHSIQYTVHLKSDQHDAHAEIPALMQEKLRFDCVVIMH